ncbi:MAG: biopolymer transporter ExbD [Elusimicrobiota bacterium]
MQNTDDDGDAITDINVTPLVDVSLVLVIIFMAISPLVLQAGIKALESKAGAAKGKSSLAQSVSLDIDADANISLNGQALSREQLPQALQKALAKSKDRLLCVRADPDLSVGTVVEFLDISKQNGAGKIVMINKNKEIQTHANVK